MEYYPATKKHEIVSSATTGLQLESIILSGVGLKEKDRCCMIPFMCVSLNHVQLLPMPWTVACQAPPSKEFSWQEYCTPFSRGSSRAWN